LSINEEFKHKQSAVCSFHHEDVSQLLGYKSQSVIFSFSHWDCIFLFVLMRKKHFKKQKKNLIYF